jgi:hypothetical protein
MATRLYLPSSGTAPLASLAYDSNWELSTGAVRLPCSTTKSNTALTNSVRRWSAATTQQWVWWQFQSEGLSQGYTWTTADTFSMVIRGLEANLACDSHVAYSVRVVSADGSTVRGTVGLYHATSTEFTTSALTRIHNARTTGATNFTSYAGDRIIIEIGVHGVTPSTAYDVTLRTGDPTATSDFALTAGLTTDLCPWVELSRDVVFGDPTMFGASDGVATVSGTLIGRGSLAASIGGGFMVTDDFEAYNTGVLGGQGNWVSSDSYDYVTVVDTAGDNRITGTAVFGVRRTETFNNDQFSQVRVDLSAQSEIGPAVRCSGVGANAYGYYYYAGDDDGYVGYRHDGGDTDLGGSTNARLSAGDVLRLEIEGTTLRCYRNGVLDTTLGGTGIYDVSSAVTNFPALASGTPGVIGLYTGMYVDDFEGGDLASFVGSIVSGTLAEKSIVPSTEYISNVVIGTEKVVNGGFDSGASWGLGTGWSISGGTLNATAVALGDQTYQNMGITQATRYRLAFEILNYSTGYINFLIGASYGVPNLNFNSDGLYSYNVTSQPDSVNGYLYVRPVISAPLNLSVDNISLKPLAIGCNGVAGVTGTLLAKGLLSGAIDGTSTASGTLKATGQLYSSSSGVALVAGTLKGRGLLQGAISTDSTVSGLLLGLGRLAVSINAIASVVGRLSSSGVFAGHIGGVASVSGSLSATVNISASINAAANVTGALRGSIIATSSGVSTVTGRILATANLVITSNGVSAVSGTLKADGRLTSSVSSTSNLTGLLRAKGRLVALVNTQAAVSADLNGRARLVGISQGVATCSLIPVLVTQAGRTDGVASVVGTLRAKAYY